MIWGLIPKFKLFKKINQFDWPISNKIVEMSDGSQNRDLLLSQLEYRESCLWPINISKKMERLGKPYGIKVHGAMRNILWNILGTQLEHKKNLSTI
jgi:hypothetical protein